MACALVAQQGTAGNTLRVETNLMLIEVRVKGRDGKPEALHSRVSFYSVLPTALTAPNSMLAEAGSTRRATQGLFAVAENTGGRAVHSTNDFSDVWSECRWPSLELT
jgi:hypothetical protein